MKKPGKTSFAQLFTTISVLMIVTITVSLSVLFFYNLRHIVANLTELSTKTNVFHSKDMVLSSIKEHEEAIKQASIGITHLLKQGTVSAESIAKYLRNILETLPNSLDLYFTNNLVWNGPGGFAAFANGWIPDDDWDNTQRPWFIDAKQAQGQIAFSEPYVDAQTGEIVVSLSMTVFNSEGTDIGVIVDDVVINVLREMINAMLNFPGQELYIINAEGLFITHEDIDAVMEKDLFTELNLDRYRNSVLGSADFFNIDKDIFIYSSAIPHTGWILVSTIPPSVIFRETNALILRLIVMCIAILIVVVVVLIFVNIFIARSENTMAEQNIQLLEANRKAEAASRSKSDFLANMSHEIRTPMNAVIGMAELLLRGELSNEARSHAQDIKQAGNNLVSIINDILDFSKIEAGKLEIIPVKYLLSSLINDSVNIVCMRIGEKPLRFFTNIDGSIPNGLIGDEVRLRQVLLNLLSNALKYSEKGHISLTITVQKRDAKQIWLKIAVTDTGKGIAPEDQARLFSEFVQVDTKKNRGIEGTGLGLAITRRLCIAMGGDIAVESEYGKGSTFTAIIPQGIDSPEPFALVEEPEKKKVLVYENRVVYTGSVCWSLENMGVPCIAVTNQDDFAAALLREEWFYVFSGYGLHENIKPMLEQPDAVFPGGKKPPLALMVEWGSEVYIPNVRFMSLPVQPLSIANILNGKADSKGYAESSGATRFTFPHARLLVVDDIATNLKVAEGLLAPYGAAIDTCLSGLQAIEMAKQHNYDIILMDHMMPEMDGIEAAAAIRKWEEEQRENGVMRKRAPIIALTANAVVGMREMFIENGFNDFLSKPIDVSKLDEILDRWIPKEKREIGNREWGVGSRGSRSNDDSASDLYHDNSNHDSPLPTIPGVNIQQGIAMTGGTLNAYRQVMALFRQDVQDRLPLLQTMPETVALPSFVTQVHALKSASASIGAADVSAMAAGLEAAGKTGDAGFIQKNLPVFAERLAELAKGIEAWEKAVEERAPEKPAAGLDSESVTPLLHELAQALQLQKANDIDRILEQLNGYTTDKDIQSALEQISDEVLMTEYGKAGEILDRLLKGGDNQ